MALSVDQINDYAAKCIVPHLKPIWGNEVKFTPFTESAGCPVIISELSWQSARGKGDSERVMLPDPLPSADTELLRWLESTFLKVHRRLKHALKVQMVDFSPTDQELLKLPFWKAQQSYILMRALRCLLGGETELWEAYFREGFDDEVSALFESSLDRELRAIASMFRAFRSSMKE